MIMIDSILNKFSDLKNWELILISVFSFFFFIRFLYLFVFTGRLVFTKKAKAGTGNGGNISLLVVFRNEENNLTKNISKILEKESNDFEVVAVDDFSQDRSLTILGVMRTKHKKLKVSSLNQETRYSTKMALNLALKAATNDWVLHLPVTTSEFTEHWPESVTAGAEDKNQAIISYSNVLKNKGTYNLLYRTENYFQFLKSVSYTCNRLAFVYNDENVAFRKEKYFELGGFGKHINEPYANLELIINSFIRKKNSLIFFDHQHSIRKDEKITSSVFHELLNRSFRIEKKLSFGKKAMLFLDRVSGMLYPLVIALSAILIPVLWPVFALIVFIHFITYLVFLKVTQSRLKENGIFFFSIFYDSVMPWLKIVYRWYFGQRSRKMLWRSKI